MAIEPVTLIGQIQVAARRQEERPPEVAGFPGVRDNYRGETIARTEHGSRRVHSDWGPEEVYECQGEHELSVLQ